jgi:hypothetical protein
MKWTPEQKVMACRDLFADSATGAGPFPVRRHSILHGTSLRFGRRAYAMRIFLMLDALHYFISEFERADRRAA